MHPFCSLKCDPELAQAALLDSLSLSLSLSRTHARTASKLASQKQVRKHPDAHTWLSSERVEKGSTAGTAARGLESLGTFGRC